MVSGRRCAPIPARAQCRRRKHGAPRRGGLRPPFRLAAQSPPAPPQGGHRRPVRRRHHGRGQRPNTCSIRAPSGPGGKGPLLPTPLELLGRIAAAVPPPRIHRHRCFGVPRIYDVVPLASPLGGADMRVIAFIADASTMRDILVHLGEPTAPPPSTPVSARPGSLVPAAARQPVATLAPAPARKHNDKRAAQPVATDSQRLTWITDPPTLRLA